LSGYAQENEHDKHEHARNEIGFSGGALYALSHNELGGGVHLHYFRTLSLHSKWSLGGGVEYAWVDGNHFNVGAGIKYQLFDRMSISTFPGVTFLPHNETDTHNTNEQRNTLFTFHFELVYDLFHFEKFHLGVVLDYSFGEKDSHAMIGLHTAFCF